MSTIAQFTAAVPAYLSFYDNKAAGTRELKTYALGLYVQYMAAEHPEGEVTPEMVLGFRQSLYGLEPNTISQYMRQVRSAYAFMLDLGMISGSNPVSSKLVDHERYQPYENLLTQADIQRILRDECPDIMNMRTYIRARAMALLCLTSGLRLSELLALTPEDLDWGRGRAYVLHGKGDKFRVVPFHEIAQQAVRRYMDTLRRGCPEGMPLFVLALKNGEFKVPTERTVQKNISSFIEGMTGRKDIYPHALRHSMASWLVSSGMNMRDIQTILGHSSIRTTERYAQLVAPDTAPVRRANTVMNIAFGKPETAEQVALT